MFDCECRFLILFDYNVINELGSNFSKKQNNFLSEHKLSQVNLTWLSQVYGKMFNFPIGWIVLENVCLNNFNIIFFNDFPLLSNDGLSYCHIVADVIATYWWCQLLADVVPMTMGYNHWCYDWLYGWRYCQYCIWLMLLPIIVWRNTIQISVDDVTSTKFWLMLLPIVWCGWCHYHLADVIAIRWRMADVKANVSDVMIPGLGYFSLSSVMLFRTSSHTWGRWYLPMFFIEGWIVNPYVYSFFDQPFLVVLLSPHHTEVVNCGVMTVMVLWSKIGEGVLKHN